MLQSDYNYCNIPNNGHEVKFTYRQHHCGMQGLSNARSKACLTWRFTYVVGTSHKRRCGGRVVITARASILQAMTRCNAGVLRIPVVPVSNPGQNTEQRKHLEALFNSSEQNSGFLSNYVTTASFHIISNSSFTNHQTIQHYVMQRR